MQSRYLAVAACTQTLAFLRSQAGLPGDLRHVRVQMQTLWQFKTTSCPEAQHQRWFSCDKIASNLIRILLLQEVHWHCYE